MKMVFSYGELIPDRLVDTFYNRIKDKMEHGEDYEHYLRNLLTINGGSLPNKINLLIEQHNDKDITPINKQGERHGYWKWYHENGKLHYKGNYLNGKQHGYWESYYNNGQLSDKGNYINGNRDGYWEYYYKNGQLHFKGNYVNGKQHGYWEFYYNNTKIKSKIYYI